MKLKSIASLLGAAGLFSTAEGAIVQFDLNSLADYSSPINSSFAGNGYVGVYNTDLVTSPFGSLFGVEQSNFSRTLLQVDVSSLIGKNILSATLSFDLLSGDSGSQTITATRFSADGSLEYSFDAPDNLLQQNYASSNGANVFDVTAFLTGELAEGSPDWLGIHLAGSDLYQWTYAGGIYAPDAANVSLTVEYDDSVSAIPEPGSTLALGFLLSSGCFMRLRRKK